MTPDDKYTCLPEAVVQLRQNGAFVEHFPAKTMLVVGAYPLAQRTRQFPVGGVLLHLLALQDTIQHDTFVWFYAHLAAKVRLNFVFFIFAGLNPTGCKELKIGALSLLLVLSIAENLALVLYDDR